MYYQLLLLLLLLLFLSILYRPHWWLKLYSYIKLLSAFASYYTTYKAPSHGAILRAKEELKNIPTHVALILNETCYRTFSLAELLCWCYTSEIRTVTIYSEAGVAEKIKNETLRDLGSMLYGQVTRAHDRITMRCRGNLQDANTVIKKSNRQARELEVIFIDRTNGKPAIVRVATEFLTNRNKRELNVEEFQREVIRESEFSAPELAIIFGPAFTTSGYPPWHLQFTEMYHFQTHKYIQWRQILSVLSSFAKTKQNYGK